VKISLMRRLGKTFLPARLQRPLRERHLTAWPPVGRVRFGSLRRTSPISSDFGFDRGRPIDRYYIEHFLAEHASDIRGTALEFRDDAYLRRFGGDALTSIDVLNVELDYPGTTIAADLATAEHLPAERFDCIVCTGVLQLIFDMPAAIRNLHRMLRISGVLLATVPGVTKVARGPNNEWEDHWRLTSLSARKLLGDVFGPERVEVESYGNSLSAIAFLMGLAADELKPAELEARHPDYEVLIAVRAARSG
jgi:SAM-dependent methyltransferase